MINPLDGLPFDINELMVNDAFNWDVTEGIDTIVKDINTVQANVTKQIIDNIGNVVKDVNGIQNAIVKPIETALANVTSDTDQLKGRVADAITSSVLATTKDLPNPTLSGNWYIVAYTDCVGTLHPVLAQYTTPPTDRYFIGPYDDPCALWYTMGVSLDVRISTGNFPQWNDPFVADYIRNNYASNAEKLSTSQIVIDCPHLIQGAMQIPVYDCNPVPPTVPPGDGPGGGPGIVVTEPPTVVVHPPAKPIYTQFVGDCDEWKARHWYTATVFADDYAHLGSYYVSDDNDEHLYLGDMQWADYARACGTTTDDGTTLPPVVQPPDITLPPVLPPYTPPTEPPDTTDSECCPPAIVNVNFESLASCCEAIVEAIKGLSSSSDSSSTSDNSGTDSCLGYSDDGLEISECAEQFYDDYLSRMKKDWGTSDQPDSLDGVRDKVVGIVTLVD